MLYFRTRQFPKEDYTISDVFSYISGTSTHDISPRRDLAAFSRSGLTMYLLGFEDPDASPETLMAFGVIPGHMQRDGWFLEEIHDLNDRSGSRINDENVEFSPFHIDSFNAILENRRRNIPLELLVKEARQARKIQASYIWRVPIGLFSADKTNAKSASRVVVAFGLARLRRMLFEIELHRHCQQKDCIARIGLGAFEGICSSISADIRTNMFQLGLQSLILQPGELVLVREGELGEPYAFETSSPETRIQRVQQNRLLYILLCNPPGPIRAAIVEVQDCLLCVAGWKPHKLVVDNDPIGLDTASFLDLSVHAEVDFSNDAPSHPVTEDMAFNQNSKSAVKSTGASKGKGPLSKQDKAKQTHWSRPGRLRMK